MVGDAGVTPADLVGKTLSKEQAAAIHADWYHRFLDDGTWLPPPPGTTPGWGGVMYVTCRICKASTDMWIEYRKYRPRACRACLLAGKGPPPSPVTVLAKSLHRSLATDRDAPPGQADPHHPRLTPQAIEEQMREAFAAEARGE